MASAACCFSEEQFRNLCAELRPPGVGGARWELLPTGHYKAFGVLDAFPPDLLADVSMDFNCRKEWDEFVKVFMYYLDNLDCPVPNWLFKWAAKKGVPTYLKNMVNTCDNYPRRS